MYYIYMFCVSVKCFVCFVLFSTIWIRSIRNPASEPIIVQSQSDNISHHGFLLPPFCC